MTALSRRLVVGTTSAALLAGVVGFVPLLGSAAAASCAAWTDPKGDSIAHEPFEGTEDPTGFFTDANLDIVSSTFGTVGDSLVATISTDALNASSSDTGDEFGFDFTVAGVALNLYADRTVFAGLPGVGTQTVLDDAGVLGPNVSGAATATYDVPKKTVTIKAKITEVAKAAEKPVAGQAVSALSSYTKDQVPIVPLGFGFPFIEYDRGATSLTTVLGVECSGGAPAPTGTGTPTGSPSPSPTATPSPSPTSTAPPAGTLFDQPRKGCVAFTDAAGDAAPTPQGNDADLDVTAVNLKSLPDALQVYVKVATLGTKPTSTNGMILNGHRFAAAITVAGKAIVATASADGPATVTVGGAANTDLKATAKFDTKNSNVVFAFPKDGLEKVAGSALAAGTAITGTKITTTAVQKESGQTRAGDTAEGVKPEEKTYAYGDNTCFLPPAGILTIEADPSGQFSDTTELYATLTDFEETPVVGATVTGVLTGGQVVSATTDEDGIAALVVPLSLAAGAKTLTAAFAGSGEVGATKASAPFTVVAEKTVLKAVAAKGGAKATVLDDDKHVVAGKPVTFLIGKTKKVVKTNAKGIAVLTGVKKGTVVKVSFAPVKGYYLGTPTYTVKAL